MSKEQTPITAEEFDRVIRQINAVNTSQDQWDVRKQKIEILKDFTQAKVLEALEREIPKAFHSGWVCRGQTMKGTVDYENEMEYYETAVKPNYQNKDE